MLHALILLIYCSIIFLVIAGNWKVYTKANQPGWAVIIPIYNLWVLTKIIGKPRFWVILFLIPVVNVAFAIWANNLLAKSFGKDEGFTVGLILLPVVFYPILGFGDAKYQGAAGENG